MRPVSFGRENGNPAIKTFGRACDGRFAVIRRTTMRAPCHSLEPDRNMTGPSLSGAWHRKAGTLPSFDRSAALKASHIEWDEKTLDEWLADPQRVVPGIR